MTWRLVLAVAILSLSLSSLLFAGQNPDLELFIEWDTYDTNYVEPVVGTLDAIVYAGNFGLLGGLSSLALKVDAGSNLFYLGFSAANGGIVIDDITGDGALIGWGTCQVPDESGKVAIGTLSYFYMGGAVPDSVRILPHAVEGSDAADCNMDIDSWCVRLDPSGNAGVWATPPAGNCDPPGEVWNVPVDAPTIQAGIDSAAWGDTVLIASGTYHEYDIVLKAYVVVRGATGDPADVIVDADSLGRVFYANAVNRETVLEGLTIQEGSASGTGLDALGGGILCTSSGNLIIYNCIFRYNYASAEGGGLKSYNGEPLILNCTFIDNYAATFGGGLDLQGDSSSVIGCYISGNGALHGGGGICQRPGGAYFERCTICSNTVLDVGGARQGGGASFGTGARPVLLDCEFHGNGAMYGGGLYVYNVGTARMNGCTIYDNMATVSGGGVYVSDCTFWPTNCTITDNEAPAGAGVRLYNSSTTFLSSIIAFNGTGPSITHSGTGTPELYCSDIYGNDGGDWVGAIAAYDSIFGNFHTDPLFCTTTWNPDSVYTLQGASKCANDTCGLIGSMPVGCGYRVEWDGGAGNGVWEDPDNWNPDRVPGEEDEAYIPGIGTTIYISMDTTVWDLTMEASISGTPSLNIVSGDTLTVIHGGRNEANIYILEDGALEILDGATFTNGDSAVFTLDAGHVAGDGIFVNRGTFEKLGSMKSRDPSTVSTSFENRLDDPGDGAIIVWDSTLSFEGAFSNECTVNVKNGGDLRYMYDGESRAESTIINSGTIIVEDGGVLTVDGEDTEFLNLDGGKVVLRGTGSLAGSGRFTNGGDVVKNDATKSRSTSTISLYFDNRFDDPGDGALRVVDGVICIEEEFTNAGSTIVRSSMEVLLDPGDGASPPHAMTNSGVLILESSADLTIQDSGTVCTNLYGGEVILEGGNIGGDGLFDNYGTLTKTDPAKSRAFSSITCALNNRHDDPGDGAIIVSEGVLSIEDVFVNSGSLFVSAVAQVLLDPGDGALRAYDMTNDGIVVVESGGDFGLNGTVSNSAGSDWVIGGTVLVDSFGEVTHYGAMEIESGGTLENDGSFAHKENAVLSGGGTFDNTEGSYSCGGVIRPGASIGTFSFLGDFYQTYSSEIHVELGGTNPGTEHDVLAISGLATLDGAMHVDIVEPFEPIEGDSFAVVTIGGAKHASRGDIDCFSGLEIPGNLYLEPVEEPDVFAFRAVDSTSSNNAPVAVDDLDSTFYNETKTLYVVENDTDVDADPVTIVSVSLGMAHGDATVDIRDTTLTYTPQAGWHGLDSLVYLVTDCNGGVDSALAVVFVPRAPRIWSVPGDAPTIQAGIDSSIARDTVELSDGTYTGTGNRDLDFNGKAIVVRSGSDDPAVCVIDCEGTPPDPHRGFYFHSGEETTSVMMGVTVTGGYRPGIGGGIRCTGASPKIVNCVLSNNSVGPGAGTTGGGIYCSYGASPVLSGCVIANNSAEHGGGIRCWDSCALRITGCTFYGNSSVDIGGALFITSSSTATIANTIIAFSASGGAVRCDGSSSVTLACCDVYENTGGNYSDCISGMNGVDGNISVDPWFCEPDSGNFALDINSPCLDAPGCSQIGAYGSACDIITLVPEMGEPDVPTRYVLSQNIPNPFNPVTKLRFSLPNSGHVKLVVYDVIGREVNVLIDRGLQAGEFEAIWNGRNRAGRQAGSGVYFARITAGEFTAVRKMVLIK